MVLLLCEVGIDTECDTIDCNKYYRLLIIFFVFSFFK